MSRKGREFEELVAHLEKILADSDMEIRSPDRIKDIHTGKKREVDVSIRKMVGTYEVLIIIECRNRKKKEDVKWIEELATKKDSVRASVAVAVSSSGFSPEAVVKAKILNIELRSIDKLTFEDVNEWQRISNVLVYMYQIMHVQMETKSSEILFSSSLSNMTANSFVFRDSKNQVFSANHLVKRLIKQNSNLFDGLNETCDPRYKRISVAYELPITLVLEGLNIEIAKFIFDVKLWVELSYAALTDVIQYLDSTGESIIQMIVHEVDIYDKKLKVSSFRDPKGKKDISPQFSLTQNLQIPHTPINLKDKE